MNSVRSSFSRVLLLAAVLALVAPARAVAAALARGPYLQRVSDQGALVVWRTTTAEPCTLAYGPLFASSIVTSAGTQHVATLTGLQAGMRYDYRIRAGGSLLAGGSNFFVKTAPAPGNGTPIDLLVWGDSGKGSAAQMAVAAVLNAQTADLALVLGDIIYPNGEANLYDARYFTPYAPLLQRLPAFAALGNHDAATLQAYLDAWYLPTNPVDGSERFYSFDFGDVHFVCLDRNVLFTTLVLDWVSSDLQSTTRKWKIVFMHQPLYSCGMHGSDSGAISALAPILDANHVDLVLQGHDHDYQRSHPVYGNQAVNAAMNPNYTNPGGTIYVVSGGGADPRTTSTACWFTAQALSVSHFSRVHISGDSLVLKAIGTAGQMLDGFTILKTGAGPPPQTVDLLAPDGGEGVQVGSTLQFRWNASSDVGPLRIELSRHGPNGPWEMLFASTPNDASENWSVSGAASDSCWARMSEASDGSPSDVSRAAFRILAAPPPPPVAFTRINFQPASAPVPSQYQADAGAVFNTARGYGWTRVMTMKARSLQPSDPRDTFVDIVNNNPVGVWEMVVPNGTYLVSLTCGDLSSTATHRVALEGAVVVANVYTSGGQFVQVTDRPVTVNDGRLTMTAGGIGNLTHTKVNSILIGSSGSPTPSPPTLTIVSPASDPTIPNSQTSYPFSGTASDAGGQVRFVEYRMAQGTWQPASGTTSWSFTASGLPEGGTLVEVRAIDNDDNTSAIASRTLTRNPPVPEYRLTVTTTGSGNVGLNPAGGLYDQGTQVTLTATAASGWTFGAWSGDLSGNTNPAQLTMSADRNVNARFDAALPPSGAPVYVGTQTGSSANVNSVATTTVVTGAAGQLYLAAISARLDVNVLSVTGLGLSWALVQKQCSGRDRTMVSLWKAQGTPSGNGIVTATFSTTCSNAVIAVSRYSNVAASNPIGSVSSKNNNGVSGACTNGVEAAAYTMTLSAASDSRVYVAAGMRDRTHTPGAGYTERSEIHKGSSSYTAGVAIEDRLVTAAGSVTANGAFSTTADWAAVAIEIRGGTASATKAFNANPDAAAVYALYPSYPNPFNPETRIRFSLPRAGRAHLAVYDVAGRLVTTLADEVLAAGPHERIWHAAAADGRALPSGVYFCRMHAASHASTIKLILAR